jgi:hypothetical protein
MDEVEDLFGDYSRFAGNGAGEDYLDAGIGAVLCREGERGMGNVEVGWVLGKR